MSRLVLALVSLLATGQAAAAASESLHEGVAGNAPGTVATRDASHTTLEPTLLPRNLLLPDVIRPLVSRMWRQSPTFRRQCARIAANPLFVVEIELAPHARHGRRAITRVERHDAGLTATVELELRRPESYVEYIAHELEHVLEHVDGVDLPRLAHAGLDGVVNLAGQYETARARAIGQAVVHEVSFH